MQENYTEHATVPPYLFARFLGGLEGHAPREAIKWSGDFAPPAIGEVVNSNMNNLGKATVTGYFVEHGWLGVIVKFHNPPQWYIRQNNGNLPGHLFGAEIRG